MLFADPLPALADAELDYLPGWVDAGLADSWLHTLVEQTPWQQPELFIKGFLRDILRAFRDIAVDAIVRKKTSAIGVGLPE